MNHWSGPYIGLPWQAGGRTPDGIDCMGLARLVLAEQAGAELPAYGDAVCDLEFAERAAPGWQRVSDIEEFDLLVFGRNGIEDHVGIALRNGRVLHIERDGTSLVQRLDDRLSARLIGIYRRCAPVALRAATEPRSDAVTVERLSLFDPARDGAPLVVAEGQSVAEIVALAFPGATETQRASFRVTLGRHVVPANMWAHVKPRAGTVLTIAPLPGFNWRLFLTIAVQVAAITAATVLAGPWGTVAASAASAAISIGGTLAINYLLPLNKGGAKQGESFAISGWRNELRPNEPVPLLFGKRRYSPPLFAQPYIVVINGKMGIRSLFVHTVGDAIASEEKIGDTPIEEFNIAGIETVLWEPGDQPPQYYDHQVVSTDPSTMGVKLLNIDTNGVYDDDKLEEYGVVRYTGHHAARGEVILRFPGGLVDLHDPASPQATEVRFAIEYQEVVPGGLDPAEWVLVDEVSIDLEELTGFFWSHEWEFPEPSQYAVRVTRVYQEESDEVQNDVDWIALQAHRLEGPINSKVPLLLTSMEIMAQEQLQGGLAAYNAVISRRALQWGGSAWTVAETSNPAAAFRFACQGPQQALPKPDAKLDLSALEDWAEYCADKGLTFDYVADADTTLIELLDMVCASGRAVRTHDGVKWGVAVDKPQTVVTAHITAHNSTGFSKSRNYRAQKFPDAIRAKFPDKLNGYTAAERIVPWEGFVGEPEVIEEIEFPWLVDAGQVYIETKRKQFEAIYRTKVYRCQQDWEHFRSQIGNRVLINHPVLKRRMASSRVRKVVGNIIELYDEIDQVNAVDYGAYFRHVPSAGSETGTSPPFESIYRSIVTEPGRSNTILLSGSGALPEAGDLVSFGEEDEEVVDAIVRMVRREDGFAAGLEFVDHASNIDTLTDAVVPPAWDGTVGEVPNDGDSPPTGRAAAYMFNLVSGELRGFARVTWTGIAGKSYQMRWRKVGSSSSSSVSVPAGTAAANTGVLVAADDYEVAVRVASGTWSAWFPVPDTTLYRLDADTLYRDDADTLLRAP